MERDFCLRTKGGSLSLFLPKAIKDTENRPVVALDKMRLLHDVHIRFALRVCVDAICEKLLVLNPWNINALNEIESDFGKRIYSLLHFRLHLNRIYETIVKLRILPS